MSRKRTITECPIEENANELSSFPCSSPVQNVSRFKIKLPVRDNVGSSLLDLNTKNMHFNQADNAAVNDFCLALKGKSHTSFSSGHPWNVQTLVRLSDGLRKNFLLLYMSARLKQLQWLRSNLSVCGETVSFLH